MIWGVTPTCDCCVGVRRFLHETLSGSAGRFAGADNSHRGAGTAFTKDQFQHSRRMCAPRYRNMIGRLRERRITRGMSQENVARLARASGFRRLKRASLVEFGPPDQGMPRA